MDDIINIDEEFRGLLPVLDKETHRLLEESLLEKGCIFPIVLWENTIIDGHNRYDLCMKHDIPFSTVCKEFRSRDDALIWIISNQVTRRNLTPILLSYYRGMHYKADKRLVTNATGRNQYSEVDGQNVHQPREQSTSGRLATQYNVSSKTIMRDSQVANAINSIGEVSPDAKRSILSGEINITRKKLNELLEGSAQDILETATSIEDGTFKRASSPKPAPLADSGVDYAALTADSGVDYAALTGLKPVHAALMKALDDMYYDLRRLTKDSDSPALKLSLRACIESLADLYLQI